MLKLKTSSKFEKQYKKLNKNEKEAVNGAIFELLNERVLGAKFRDHALKGEFASYRECHVKPNLLLVYKIQKEEMVLACVRVGSHSEIFG